MCSLYFLFSPLNTVPFPEWWMVWMKPASFFFLVNTASPLHSSASPAQSLVLLQAIVTVSLLRSLLHLSVGGEPGDTLFYSN